MNVWYIRDLGSYLGVLCIIIPRSFDQEILSNDGQNVLIDYALFGEHSRENIWLIEGFQLKYESIHLNI